MMLCISCNIPMQPDILGNRNILRGYSIKGWPCYRCSGCSRTRYSETVEYLHMHLPILSFRSPWVNPKEIDYEDLVDKFVKGEL